jgi:Integrase core domain
VCELRRAHPRWGARRISHELGRRGVTPTPSRSTVHRVLVRNHLVRPQAQQHPRHLKRWQREAPMQLWQLDLLGGVFLADRRECKLLTGLDDHSRLVVIATVLARPTGRAVCEAFATALGRYGVPSEVLTDNGKQFTAASPSPARPRYCLSSCAARTPSPSSCCAAPAPPGHRPPHPPYPVRVVASACQPTPRWRSTGWCGATAWSGWPAATTRVGLVLTLRRPAKTAAHART